MAEENKDGEKKIEAEEEKKIEGEAAEKKEAENGEEKEEGNVNPEAPKEEDDPEKNLKIKKTACNKYEIHFF